MKPKIMLILSENWTITGGQNLRSLVDWAVMAEDAGVDAVMISEHISLGPAAGAKGREPNERAYMAPGNQDPATPWPYSQVLLSGIAARTTKLRLFAGAIIVPLRHPVHLAKQLASLDPFGAPSADDLAFLANSLAEAGRDISEIEMVGGIRATFPDNDSPADLDLALESIPPQMEKGFTTFCVKPNQFIDDAAAMPQFLERLVTGFDMLS